MARNLETLLTTTAGLADRTGADLDEKVNLARSALELVWEKGEWRRPDANTRSQPGATPDRVRPVAALLPFLQNIPAASCFRLILGSLKAATAILEHADVDEFERRTEILNSVAEVFSRLRDLRQSAGRGDWESDRVTKAVDADWRVVGRFVDLAPFRLAAILFYEALLETPELQDQTREIGRALHSARQRKTRRDLSREDRALHPGQEWTSENKNTSVRFLQNGAAVVLEYYPAALRVKFMAGTESPEIDSGMNLDITSREAGVLKGKASVDEEWSCEIEWHFRENMLRFKSPEGQWVRAARRNP